MRLVGIEVEGFRGYAVSSYLDVDDLTVLAGRNDAGKSTMFDALKLFLSKGKPDALDHSVNGQGTIRITCTFSDLPPTLVIDESTPTTLLEENLLDERGYLRITKAWSRGKTSPEISAWALHPVGEDLPYLIGQKQGQLKKIAADLGVTAAVSDRRMNLNFRRAIWEAWAAGGLSERKLVEIPLNAEDGKQVALALESVFPIFHLFQADRVGSESEDVAQDPAKLVVESVLERHTERLAALTTEVQSEIEGMLAEVVVRLEEIAPELASKLAPVNLKPSWQKAFSALQFVDEQQVPLSKRGSGTRRLVLLSFFRAEVERGYEEAEGWRRGIIIAVEEPETALHPDLQRETLVALADVAGLPNRQVLLTTHSSNLIRDIPIESVRFVEEQNGTRIWMSQRTAPNRKILEHLSVTMGTFTDHNVRCFLVVEGRNDIAGILQLSDGLRKASLDDFPDLRALEKQGEICFIPIGGCGAAALWESRLSPFRRREVHILDSDKTSEHAPLKRHVADHVARYNAEEHPLAAVTVLARREMENYLTLESIETQFAEVPEFGDEFRSVIGQLDWNYADIPSLVARALHAVRSPLNWDELTEEKKQKKESDAKRQLVKCFSHESVADDLLTAQPDLLSALRNAVRYDKPSSGQLPIYSSVN
jgi:hypothetical protein